MKLLFICHRLPYPPNRGGKIRPFNMIRHLAQRHQVWVASLAGSAEELRDGQALREHGVELLAELVPPAVRWRQSVAALPTAQPSSAAYFWSPALRRRIEAASSQVGFDAVMVHCAFVGAYADGIPSRLRIMDFGDLDSAKWAAYAHHRPLPLSLGYALESRKLRRHEQRLAAAFNRVTVTTSGELDEFRRLGVDRPATVIPNGVDTRYFRDVVDQDGESATVVFLGRMDYFPNIDGVQFFVREVLPLVRQKVPHAEFRIVGSSPGPAIRRLARLPGITVTGTVPDVRPHLRDTAVSVAPLRIARGTQNKILESMAAGVPVVATTAAAKGIQAAGGRHLLVADDPNTFAEAVVALLQDRARRRDLVEAARREVLSAHDWPASMRILDSVLSAG
jgi:sugar transferase (PEP-CTERM/EpsH1 system associated)